MDLRDKNLEYSNFKYGILHREQSLITDFSQVR